MFSSLKNFVIEKKQQVAMAAVGTAAPLALATSAFAADESSGSGVSAVLTSEMLQPLLDGVVANINVILPIGIGLFAIFIGISVIPKIIQKFTN